MEEFRQRFIEARRRAGVSQDDIAKLCGISRHAVSQWELGNTQPTLRNVQKVVMLLNTTVGWLIGEQKEFDRHHLRRKRATQKIPVIDHEMATYWYDQERPRKRPITTITSTQMIRYGGFALKIKDTSMQPALVWDDLVIIDTKVKPDPGQFVVAHCLIDDEVVVRRYMPQPTSPTESPIIALQAINEDWPDIELSVLNPGRLIGTVVELRRQNARISAYEIVGTRNKSRNTQQRHYP